MIMHGKSVNVSIVDSGEVEPKESVIPYGIAKAWRKSNRSKSPVVRDLA